MARMPSVASDVALTAPGPDIFLIIWALNATEYVTSGVVLLAPEFRLCAGQAGARFRRQLP